MFKKKDKEITMNTVRIARGTSVLATMSDKLFISTYKKMEARKASNPAEYHLPDWFTIKFKRQDKDIYEFIGSFNEGDVYPLVYKKDFLKILRKNKIEIQQIDEDIYKIIRKQS